MAQVTFEDLRSIPGKVTKTGLQFPSDPLYNCDMICLPDGGLMLMLANDKLPGRIVSYQDGAWRLIKDIKRQQFDKGCMTLMPDQSVLVMSDAGDILVAKDGKARSEKPIPPDQTEYMCKISCIDGVAYAVGTERNVWKRVSADNWIPLHDPMRHPGLDDLTGLDMGFQTIAASAQDNIYISGYAADTWHFDGQSWTQIELPWQDFPHIKAYPHPRAPSLRNALMTPDGMAYLGGSAFTLLRCDGHDWELIDLGDLRNSRHDIGELTWFQDRLYFGSTDSEVEIASIGADGIVQPLLRDGKPVKAYCVCASEAYLYVCGTRGSVHAFDGRDWRTL